MTTMGVGARLGNPAIDTEVIVVRAAAGEVVVVSGGLPLGEDRSGGQQAEQDAGSFDDEQVLLGKRYLDEPTGLEVLCTKSGPGPLVCNGRQLTLKAAKPLPSSD